MKMEKRETNVSLLPAQGDVNKTVIRFLFCLTAAFVLQTVVSDPAFAITAPADGFAYDIYDIAVNRILKGPIGFVAGAAAIVIGAVAAIQQKVMGAVPAILGGAALLKADAITASLGALI